MCRDKKVFSKPGDCARRKLNSLLRGIDRETESIPPLNIKEGEKA